MNADRYCRILDYCLLKSVHDLNMKDFIFQHDNDLKHTSAKVKEYLDLKRVKIMSLSSQSLDKIQLRIFDII